jgi:hypothetical protein
MKIITLTRPAPYPFGGKTLIPGDNRVDDEYLAELTANPAVQSDISAGILQIGHGAVVMPGSSLVEPAPAPVDMDALRALADGDGRRKDVQEARALLAEMEAKAEDGE